MKKLYLILMMILCASNIMAQTYCEKVFTNAVKLFNEQKFKEAKQKFEAVKQDCPDKDIASVYVQLCEEKIKNVKLRNDKFKLDKQISGLEQEKQIYQEKLASKRNEYNELYKTKLQLDNQIEEFKQISNNQDTRVNDSIIQKRDERIRELETLLTSARDCLDTCQNLSLIKRVFYKDSKDEIGKINNQINSALSSGNLEKPTEGTQTEELKSEEK